MLERVGLQGDPGLEVLHPPADTRYLTSAARRYLRTSSTGLHIAGFHKAGLGLSRQWPSVIMAYIAIPRIRNWIGPSKQILAIQPFKTLRDDPESRRLAEIAREEIFTRMSELHPQKLGVVELTTADSELGSSRFVQTRKPNLILAGAIHRDGNQMAITDQLVSCKDQTGIAGDRYG